MGVSPSRKAAPHGILEPMDLSAIGLGAFLESTPDAVWVKSPEGRYLLANAAFADLIGRRADTIVGRLEAELLKEGAARQRAALEALAADTGDRFEASLEVIEGEMRTYHVVKSPFSKGGAVIGTLAVARDISDRKAAEDKLLRAAHHDFLTGLPNRGAFRDRVARALSRWRHRPDHAFAVLFVDIDHFKEVNDHFGHAAGDELLQAFTSTLDHALRPGDYVARYGGDEFTVLLQGVRSRTDAEAVARRILTGLGKPFKLSSVEALSASTSIGVAMVCAELDSVDALLHAADAAMYQAKAQGRSRMVVA